MSEPATKFEQVHAILRWFSETECIESLYWNTVPGAILFWVQCNDMFWWGTADAEDVGRADIKDLQEAYQDLQKVDDNFTCYAPELWVARKRGMRPQTPWWDRERFPQEIKDLFLAAGPPRDRKEEG